MTIGGYKLNNLMSNSTQKRLKNNKKASKSLQGWECPKCGSVYAIWVDSCSTCKNSNIRLVTSSESTYVK